MRRFVDPARLYLVLALLVIAFLSALVHPFSSLLSVLPFNTTPFREAIESTRTFAVDFLSWGLCLFAIFMAGVVTRDRLVRRRLPVLTAASAEETHAEAPRQRLPAVVAVTAYNDGEATAQTVKEFLAQDDVIEVVVVDNNSTDNTVALATAAGARVVVEPNQGYGFACIRGLQEALANRDAELIVLTEGDGTFAGSDLAKFQAYTGQADMILGSRVVPNLVDQHSQMDHFFIWGNIAVSSLLRVRFWNSQFLGAARLSDVGCTYRAVRRRALERILPMLRVGGNSFSAHMMVVALAEGLRIVEIPITFRRRIGESKGGSRSVLAGLKVGLTMLYQLLTYRHRPAGEPVTPATPLQQPMALEMEPPDSEPAEVHGRIARR